VARRGLQMSTDRAADLITVLTVALPEGQFDCNLLLRNGVPAYRIETAVATIHFVVDGDERSAKITATANFGSVLYVNEYGTRASRRATRRTASRKEACRVASAKGQ
jgi:hypothetical protein